MGPLLGQGGRQGGIRVPVIAYWKGTLPAGSTSHIPTTQWDIMPTIADAGGKPITQDMDGISILPTLSNNFQQQTKRDYLYFEFYEGGKQQSVRKGNWKAYYRKGGWDAPIELYDLSKDIGETEPAGCSEVRLAGVLAQRLQALSLSSSAS